MDLSALYEISYGLYVVSSTHDGRVNGQIANTVFQVTSEPPRIAVSINKKNLTHEYIRKSGVFGVSVLDQSTPLSFVGLFGFKSGRDADKFPGVSCEKGVTGCVLVTQNSTSILEARVVTSMDAGTHTVFLGDVVSAKRIRPGTPMTYAYYHAVKRGTAPPEAPTFRGAAVEGGAAPKAPAGGAKYVCSVCGYVYDSAVGDPASGAAPGTAFEDLPDDWTCPICGVGKDRFSRA